MKRIFCFIAILVFTSFIFGCNSGSSNQNNNSNTDQKNVSVVIKNDKVYYVEDGVEVELSGFDDLLNELKLHNVHYVDKELSLRFIDNYIEYKFQNDIKWTKLIRVYLAEGGNYTVTFVYSDHKEKVMMDDTLIFYPVLDDYYDDNDQVYYYFDGWCNSSGDKIEYGVHLSSDLTFYPLFTTTPTYKICFYVNNELDKVSFIKSGLNVELYTPTLRGYVLLNWYYLQNNQEIVVGNNTIVNSDMDLYAKLTIDYEHGDFVYYYMNDELIEEKYYYFGEPIKNILGTTDYALVDENHTKFELPQAFTESINLYYVEGTYWDKDLNGIPDWQEEECTITFATWAYTSDDYVTMDTLMADAFMEKYPNIHIEFKIVGEEYDYDTNMLCLMEVNEMPDVFLIRRLETFLPYNMLADITDMYNNDPDTQYIFQSLQSSGVFNGRRYAVPTYIYPEFWVVNKTLLAEKNIPIPTYDWTWDQMVQIAKQATDDTKHIIGLYGREGYYGEGGLRAFRAELPKILKMKENRVEGSKWAADGFDGERFNFDDNVYLESMNRLTTAVNEGWVKAALTAEQKLEYYNDEAYVPSTSGKVAVWREPSWSFKDEMSKIEFEWDIYPGPSGVTGGNTDIIGISSLSAHKQAAYQFMKWMSYSEDGILARFDIFENSGDELYQQGNNYPYPIADYGMDATGHNKIWENIPYGSTAPGLVTPQYLESLRNGAFIMNKEICGWDAVDYAVWEYFDYVYSGELTYAAVKQSIQDAADLELKRVRDELLLF